MVASQEECPVDVPNMPLFEPSHDEAAREVMKGQDGAGLLWEGETAFSWVANESFWSNLMSQAQLSQEAKRQPLFKVHASHDDTAHLINQSWLKAFVGAWSTVNPHTVIVEAPGGKKEFHASGEFWNRAVNLKPASGNGAKVRIKSDKAPGIIIEASAVEWRALIDDWEAEKSCTPAQREATLSERRKEIDALKASPSPPPPPPPLPPTQSVIPGNPPPSASLTTSCHKCEELSERVRGLEEILSLSSLSPGRDMAASPTSPSSKTSRKRVKSIRDIKVPGVGVAIPPGVHGLVTEEAQGREYVVRWDRRVDGRTSRVRVEKEWVVEVNSGKLADPGGELSDVFDKAGGAPMEQSRFCSLMTDSGILSQGEAVHIYDLASGADRAPLSYDAFIFRALPLVAEATERPNLVANLLGVPTFSSSLHSGGGSMLSTRTVFTAYQTWLNQSLPP